MKTLLSVFLFLGLLTGSLTTSAQVSAQIGTGTLVPAATLYGPVYRFSSTSTTDGARVNMLWTAAEMATAAIPAGAIITGVEFHKTNTANFSGPVPFKMLVANTTNTALNTTDTWAGVLASHTQVINNTTFNLPATTGWVPFTFTTPFTYTGGAFEVATEHDISALTSPQSTDEINWEYTDNNETKIVGVASPTGATLNGTVAAYKERPNIRIIYTIPTPCTAPPTPGTAAASVTTVCPNVDFTLTMTGGSIGTGQTYQWQTAPASTGPWTGIGTPSASTALTRSQTATTFYRVAVTCSGQTAFTNSVQVTTNANPVSGTFTINKNSPASATNFTSFAAALTSLECGGVNGAVTFNVVSNTGPYNEQVIIPAISGTSATNRVTFNGNGNVLTFAPTTANRSVIRLNGADFITITGFDIQATDATYGWGIHLTNTADNNTISNNTISIASTSTTESNSVGIAISGSTTSITTTGNNGNNNLISNNTINGGYKNIQISGLTTATGNNQILNNILRDSYADAIELNAAKGTLVEGNDISRPTRTAIGTASGITLSGGSLLSVISKNRIHNTHDMEATPTTASYGIYITASDAPVGSENIVKNNVLYNFNSTGAIYGIYNSGSDGAHYYHNTIHLDNTNNTGAVRGFYQTTSATNIKFINNIVFINSGATGVKNALYFGTAASTIVSNNNVLYVDPAATNAHIGFYSANQTTLAAWKAANSSAYDQASVSANPDFVSPATGNLLPANPLVNNIGQPLTMVTDAINGVVRSTTTPDPGAYEFSIPTFDAGITAIVSPTSVCGLSGQENVTVTITNFGNAPLTSVPVSYQIGTNAPVTATFTGNIAPGASTNFTFTTQANLSATGSYTIVASTNLTGDATAANNSITSVVTNSRFATLPQLNFETTATGIGNMRLVTNSRSAITEGTAASLGTGSTKGLILDAVSNPGWVTPTPTTDPWTVNPEHFAGAYICFSPAGGSANDPLWLSFDLKQLFKTANANTNFRVTVNGTQVGTTYRPPFTGTPIDWQKVYVNLTPYKGLPGIEIGFESSTSESFANGAGTANLIDNIQIVRVDPTGTKENLLAASVNVYPNPSNGTFTVSLPKGQQFELEVTDLTGKVITRQSVKTGSANVMLNETAKGIYLLKITSEGNTATKKLVVQ